MKQNQENENKKINKEELYKIIMIVSISVFMTFIITTIGLYNYFVNNPEMILATNSKKNDTDSQTISSKLSSYRSIIDKYYLGEIDEEALEEGAISGYIDGLGDPYTEYISKEDMKAYLEDTMGNFIGIGIYMVKNTEYDKIEVLSTIKNGPAEKAGIKAGDIIISVDGKTYTANQMTEAANNIKGEEKTNVKVVVMRNQEETLEFDLIREKIKVNQVEGEVLENNIGYIKFTSFDETTAADFKKEFESLKNQGITSLIVDLRNNGGGIVDQSLKIADYFVEKDTVLLYEIDKNDKETIKKAKDDAIVDVPVIILTNKNTASASEILAGALKDLGKAKIVGKTTYGKGIIQQILQLKDGSGLKVTIEEYQTPNKNKINKVGITPDVEVEASENKDEDAQLQKAIEMLK